MRPHRPGRALLVSPWRKRTAGEAFWHPFRVRTKPLIRPGVSSQAPQPPANFWQPLRVALRWECQDAPAQARARVAGITVAEANGGRGILAPFQGADKTAHTPGGIVARSSTPG